MAAPTVPTIANDNPLFSVDGGMLPQFSFALLYNGVVLAVVTKNSPSVNPFVGQVTGVDPNIYGGPGDKIPQTGTVVITTGLNLSVGAVITEYGTIRDQMTMKALKDMGLPIDYYDQYASIDGTAAADAANDQPVPPSGGGGGGG